MRKFLASACLAAAGLTLAFYGTRSTTDAASGMLPVTVLSQTGSTMILGWTPPAGAAGYEFTVDGKRVSNTWNPDPTWACPASVTGMACVKFGVAPGHSYGVTEVVEGVSGSVTVTTAGTTTTPPTTTATAPGGYEQATAYTQTPPAFTVKRDVPVASSSQLQQAVASIQCGDKVHATAPITVGSEWQITAAPACPAVIDVTNVTIAYTGSSALPSVWINGASNLRLFGGDIHGPAKGQPGAGGISIYKATNILWWGFHVHDVAHDGLDIFPIGGPIDNLDLAGEIDHWGGYIADDPHAEKGTGFHGVNIADAGTGVVTNSRFAFDLHDGPTGAGVEIGSGSSSGRIAGITMYLRARNLTMAATSQVAGNAIQWWGAVPIQMDVPYLEANSLQGRATDGQGVYSGVSMAGVHVGYGRATGTNQNPALARTEGGIAASDPWDKRHGEQYGDIAATSPPVTTAPATTTAPPPPTTTRPTTTTVPSPPPTTTTTTSGGTFSYALRQDFENGGSGPGSLLCGGATPPAHAVWGTFANIASNGQGARAATFSLPADTSIKQRCQIDEVTHRTLVMGSDEFFTLMLYVPAAAANNYPGTTAAWGPQLWEPEYQGKNSGQPSFTFHLQSDWVRFVYCTGNGPGCQYGGLPKAVAALPHGQLVAGWHEFIVGVHLSDTTTGSFQVWHRLKGQSAWTQTINLAGLPTVQTPYSGTAYDVLMAYRGPAATPFSVTLDDFTRSSSFAAAAAALP